VAPLPVADIIARKRDGGVHAKDELDSLIAGVTSGSVPDYQAAAWLMAAFIRGLTPEETRWLTQAMAASGKQLHLAARWPDAVDKHSTGGVGDKTSLVLMPALAAAGCHVAKMSGRGLGFSGGTADKLEAIPGLRTELSLATLLGQVERIGIAMVSQSEELAPADGKLYALRDVTGTVESLPLIASSIMSKKLATQPARLVLDVKAGRGAFMKMLDQAGALAELMVAIGRASGIQTSAVISEMDQPEGYAVGHALEVREALETLRGRGPADVVSLCEILGGALGVEGVGQAIRSGAALAKLREMVAAQGGDAGVVDDPERLPRSGLRRELPAPHGGWIAAIDAQAVGRVAMELGAGRAQKGDAIDHAVGLVLKAKVGDWVDSGQPLVEVHANDEARLEHALAKLPAAYSFSEQPVQAPDLVKAIIPAS
jgi:pyrimidine-nucleoside phosphorylase